MLFPMLLPFASQGLVCLRSEDNSKIALKKIPAAIVTYIDEEAEYGIHLFITQENRKSTEGSNDHDPTKCSLGTWRGIRAKI